MSNTLPIVHKGKQYLVTVTPGQSWFAYQGATGGPRMVDIGFAETHPRSVAGALLAAHRERKLA